MIRKEFYKSIISLKVPTCWTIIKNNLISVPFEVINALNDDELFDITEFYLRDNVFQARMYLQGTCVDEVAIWVSSYPSYKNNQLIGLSYDIDIYAKNNKITGKKRHSNLFTKTLKINSLDILKDTLNTLMLNAYYEFNQYSLGDNFNFLLENIDQDLFEKEEY